MIDKWLVELIKKYSFIKDYDDIGINFIFYLQDDCKVKSFKINKFRTNKEKLMLKIKKIKTKIGYDNDTGDWERQTKNK